MPETFRRGRIAEFVQRLIWRKNALSKQLDEPDLVDQQVNIKGQIQAVDMIIRELIQDFEIQEEDLR